ncbi:MAG: leucyl/phenylalanyl-tRNA--protein transferase [Cyanobacteria bacterium P01_A01_bin.17]
MNFNIPKIVERYRQGFFLMADDDGSLGWYTSVQRTLIPLDDRFRYPRSLQRVLNQNRFTEAVDWDFPAVVAGCANRDSTWISEDLRSLYLALHEAGYAHSFETWQDGQLAGGILGIVIGGIFIGESMFFNISEGSKVAMVKLVEHLRSQHFHLFDAQIMNPHLARFGAYTISDKEYQQQLQKAVLQPCLFKQ